LKDWPEISVLTGHSLLDFEFCQFKEKEEKLNRDGFVRTPIMTHSFPCPFDKRIEPKGRS
jgi:hypothetical protein